MNKEKKKIVLLETHKIFMAIQFLKQEETDVFTDYGKGLVEGLLDKDMEKRLPIVPVEEYEKLEKKLNFSKNELIRRIEETNKLKNIIKQLKNKKPWWKF